MALIDNLVAYYKFNENTGTSSADSKGTYNGTFGGTLGSQWVVGKNDYALYFNGTDNYFDTTWAPSISSASSLSFAWWAKVPSSSVTTSDSSFIGATGGDGFSQILLCYHSKGPGGVGYTLSGKLCAFYNADAGYTSYIDVDSIQGTGTATPNTSPDLRDDAWHFLCAVYNGSTLSLYVDNVKTCDASGFTNTANLSSFYIGANHNSPQPANVAIDNVGIWTKALTDNERELLWNRGQGLLYPFHDRGFAPRDGTVGNGMSKSEGWT